MQVGYEDQWSESGRNDLGTIFYLNVSAVRVFETFDRQSPPQSQRVPWSNDDARVAWFHRSHDDVTCLRGSVSTQPSAQTFVSAQLPIQTSSQHCHDTSHARWSRP